MNVTLDQLNEAIQNRDVECIKNFLRVHLDHGCLDKKTLSEAVLEASKVGMLEIVDFILRSTDNVDLNYVDDKGRNALSFGIKNDSIDIVKLLIEKGANVNLDDDSKGNSDHIPLHAAAKSDDVSILTFLIKNGAKVNAANKVGTTALHHAIKCNNIAAAKLLLEHGADLTSLDGFTTAPLSSAIMMESPEMVQLLLKSGADPNAPDLSGMEMGSYKCSLLHTAQMLKATSADISNRILQMLIEAGARLNQIDSYDYTPLHHCIRRCNNLMFNMHNLKLLVEAGARLESIHRQIFYKNYKPESFLLLLQCYSKWEAIQYLVEAGWELHREPCIDVVLENVQERKQELYDVMRTLHLHPVPLTYLCRTAIKRHLLNCTGDRSIYLRVRELPLPQSMRDFIKGIT